MLMLFLIVGRRASTLKPGERACKVLKLPVSQSATGSSSQPPTRSTSNAGASGREKPETPLFKPQRFDGRSILDTILLQFEQLSEYMQWGERARRYHLSASLERPACQMLMELPATGSTSADVNKLLQSKFGMKLQAESFQAKLKARTERRVKLYKICIGILADCCN